MKHHIIAKFTPEGKAQENLYQGIYDVFEDVVKIDGIHNVSFHTSVIDRPNRYDLMICIEMDKEALPLFDESAVHANWKSRYTPYLESKAIFDCD